MRKRIVIGDIHGRLDTFRRIYETEDPDDVILLGDYVDSRVVSPEDSVQCYWSIKDMRTEHIMSGRGEFVMLVGNHEWHYINNCEQYTGKNTHTMISLSPELSESFHTYKDLKVCYVDRINHTIYSHAGVSNTWYDTWIGKDVTDDPEAINEVNTRGLDFAERCNDIYGDSVHSGPLFIRPRSLMQDLFTDKTGLFWVQIVGHTHSASPIVTDVYGNDVTNDPSRFASGILHLIDCIESAYIVETINDDGFIVERKLVRTRHD